MERSDRGDDLVGTKEAARLFGVRPQNLLRDWVSRPDFPAPIATLAATRVWSRAELEAYRDEGLPGIAWPPRRDLRLSPSAERWLPTIKRRIARRFRPTRIVVFGSQARGEATDDSDIDLLVVLDEATDTRETSIAIREALRDIPVAKDIVVTTAAHVQQYGDLVGTVIRPALREGVTIFARA